MQRTWGATRALDRSAATSMNISRTICEPSTTTGATEWPSDPCTNAPHFPRLRPLACGHERACDRRRPRALTSGSAAKAWWMATTVRAASVMPCVRRARRAASSWERRRWASGRWEYLRRGDDAVSEAEAREGAAATAPRSPVGGVGRGRLGRGRRDRRDVGDDRRHPRPRRGPRDGLAQSSVSLAEVFVEFET